jgi:hypothetical protein
LAGNGCHDPTGRYLSNKVIDFIGNIDVSGAIDSNPSARRRAGLDRSLDRLPGVVGLAA